MEVILLLGIYSFFVWLIFVKFKWLPWNIIRRSSSITIPIVGLTPMILRSTSSRLRRPTCASSTTRCRSRRGCRAG